MSSIEKLKKEIEFMKPLLDQDASMHHAFVQMTRLLEEMTEFLEDFIEAVDDSDR